MRFRLPKNKSQLALFICAVIYVAMGVYIDEFLDIDLLTADDTELFYHWLLCVIRDLSLIIAISGGVILGIQSLRRGGFSIKRFILPVVFVLICLFMSGISIWGYITCSDIQQRLFYYDDDFRKSLEESLDKKVLTLPQRSELSLMYAKQVWWKTGETIKYITRDGNETLYAPSVKEIETKQQMNRTNELMTRSIKGMKTAAILWPIIAIGSISIGFLSPVKKINMPNISQKQA